MLVEIAVGDAYGAGFEYAQKSWVDKRNMLMFDQYTQHPWHKLKPGCYTDDTQMSIAIAEAIISDAPWTKEMLADRFVSVFKRDPRQSYSRRFYELLRSVNNGSEFLATIDGHQSTSGAAMRATPIGIYPDIKTVIEHSTVQATVTHNTNNGIRASVASSLMAHYFIYRLGSKKLLPEFIMEHVPGRWYLPWRGMVGSEGIVSVSAAITAIVLGQSLVEILKTSVAFKGDTDTVAAMALGAACFSTEVEQNLSSYRFLIEDLENGVYGLNFLQQLDKKLLQYKIN